MTEAGAIEASVQEAEAVLTGGWLDGRAQVSVLGDGRINDTYLVDAGDAGKSLMDMHGATGGRRFVLQRVNTAVFVDPERLMAQLGRILRHMQARKPGWLPALVPAREGDLSVRDPDGGFWRLWRFVESGRRPSDRLTPELAFQAAAAFGTFQRLLSDLEGEALLPTIDGFLELTGYLDRFDAVLDRETIDLDGLDELIRFVAKRRGLATRFPRGSDYVHGDCKLDNLLFARDGSEVVAVLDLDTVMPGHWAWDFGDLTRSLLTGSGPLDEGGSTALFGAATHGFIGARGFRPPGDDLLDAPVYVAFMLGVRFLTDHLEGDRYFKVAAAGDNLARAVRQFDLVREIERQRPRLEDSVAGVLAMLEDPD